MDKKIQGARLTYIVAHVNEEVISTVRARTVVERLDNLIGERPAHCNVNSLENSATSNITKALTHVAGLYLESPRLSTSSYRPSYEVLSVFPRKSSSYTIHLMGGGWAEPISGSAEDDNHILVEAGIVNALHCTNKDALHIVVRFNDSCIINPLRYFFSDFALDNLDSGHVNGLHVSMKGTLKLIESKGVDLKAILA